MSVLVKTLFAGVALSLMIPGVVLAQDEAAEGGVDFRRDRNISVQQRVPAEYRALGLKWGGFTASPRLIIDLEQTDNVYYRETNEESDFIVRLRPELGVRSNWSRHRLSGLARVGTTRYADHNDESNNEWLLNASGRYDIVGASNVFGSLTVNQAYDQRGEEATLTGAAEPVKFTAQSGQAGFVAVGNRMRLVGRAAFQKLDYEDARANGGGIVEQDDRDRTETRTSLRGEYAVSPDTSVFAYYEINKRDYDLFGAVNNSDGHDMGVGVSFDLTRLIRGEVQVGQYKQNYENSAFGEEKGASYNARIEWFPTQLTTVGFTASQAVYETPAIGASGVQSTVLGVSVDHELRRNIILSAGYARTKNEFNRIVREDERARFDLAVRYRMNRKVAVVAGYTYSDLSSEGTDRVTDYENNTFKLNLTLSY
ncbi:MAG: outer membrane beta-barrel protein [Asticcacaulis sp.]